MTKDYMVDSHIHTEHSIDSEAPIDEICERAYENGLKAVTFTDHCEIDKMDNLFSFLDDCVEDYLRVKEKYSNKIEVLIGTEIGQPITDKKMTADIISKYDFDFVIGSVHCAPGDPDFSFLDYTIASRDPYRYLDPYFDELLKTAKWGKMDALAHITYPLRYFVGVSHMDVDMTRYYDIIDEVYKSLISGGVALEINASGLRQEIGKTLPDEFYLTRYRELGGELITVGSDAHFPQDVGTGIARAMEIAKSCGFKYLACYKKRKPVMIKL